MPRSSSHLLMSAIFPIVSSPRTDWSGGAPCDCDSVRAGLDEYVDDEWDRHVPSERAILLAVASHVASHVANCLHCARVAAVGARMRVVELPRRSSPESELAMVPRVTADVISQRAHDASRDGSPDDSRRIRSLRRD